MGLHRDGEFLGLSPFEAEMRRRLWWAIIMVDSKYALYSGLSHSFLPRGWDTKAPKNLNDADIFPSATEPFQDREGPTEMIFCMLTNKFGQFLVETPGFEVLALLEEQGSPASANIPEEQLSECRQHVEKLAKDLLEILDKYCDPMAGPVHQMAITIREHIVRKFEELLKTPKHQQEWSGEVQTQKDNTFKVAVCTLEHNEANYMSAKDKGFMWFSLLHFQLDVFVYVAGQLCHRTEGTLVDRAWRQVDVVYTFHPELFETTSKVHAALAVFILKAWRKREETLLARTGQIPDTPFYIDKLRASFPDDKYKSEPTPPDPYTPASLATGFHPGVQDGTLDGYLGYLDWDMFDTNVMPNGGQSSSSFGGFGMGGMGPSVEW